MKALSAPTIQELEVDGWLSLESIVKRYAKGRTPNAVEKQVRAWVDAGAMTIKQEVVMYNGRRRRINFFRPNVEV